MAAAPTTSEEIARRMQAARDEIATPPSSIMSLVNDEFDRALAEMPRGAARRPARRRHRLIGLPDFLAGLGA